MPALTVLPAFDASDVIGVESSRADRLALLRKAKVDAVEHLNAFTEWLEAARQSDGFIVASADIDGMTCALQVAQASGWRIAALVPSGSFTDSGRTLFAPDVGARGIADAASHDRLIAVDTYSPGIPSISNHPVFMGSPLPFNVNDKDEARRIGIAILDHDHAVRDMVQPIANGAASRFCLNPNVWAGIIGTARKPDDLKFKRQRDSPAWRPVFEDWSAHARHVGDPVADPDDLLLARLQKWKYPLGSAQVVSAAIDYAEARLGPLDLPIDRDFLPFIIANADDGLGAYFHYADHARDWWGLLCSLGGPRIESLIHAVERHGIEGMLSARRRFGHDFTEHADLFDDAWNYAAGRNLDTQRSRTGRAIRALATLAGFDDPFFGGIDRLDGWTTERSGLPDPELFGGKIKQLPNGGAAAFEQRLLRIRNAQAMAISIRDGDLHIGIRSHF